MEKPKILYAVQGTGNGHIVRAIEMLPVLRCYAEVDILLSGNQSQVKLPFAVKYRRAGLVLHYNRRGGVSMLRTLLGNNLLRLLREIRGFPVQQYDLVLNDFECVSAWAARWRGRPVLDCSHQAALLQKGVPRPRVKNVLAELILRTYAPAQPGLRFHYQPYAGPVQPPVIREDIRRAQPTSAGPLVVYLPAYADDFLVEYLQMVSNRDWLVFSPRCSQAAEHGNVRLEPVSREQFTRALIKASGVLTSAGFETPSEALYLGKKLFVVPIKGQYEQACNAEALHRMGVPVVRRLHGRSLQLLREWAYASPPVPRVEAAELKTLVGPLLEQNLPGIASRQAEALELRPV
jgi:uncharacterized protein (TIGR00661 family)